MERIKGLFATPKKAMITCLIIVLSIIVLSVGAVFAAVYFDRNEDVIEQKVEDTIAPADTQTTAPATEESTAGSDTSTDQQTADSTSQPAAAPNTGKSSGNIKKISQKRAESIALKDAGFSSGQVSNLFSHLDFDDGYYEYEVQFYKGDMEYDYTLDAGTGRILEKDIESIYD